MPAIGANLLTMVLSFSVDVGDLKRSVSEIMAEHKRPAVSLEGVNPFYFKY